MKEDKQVGSGIAATNLQEMLESAKNAGDKGQSQFFTPRDFGRMVSIPLPRLRPVICDLNCGAGHLLLSSVAEKAPWTTDLLGCDIDNVKSAKGQFDKVGLTRIVADLTKLYPLLAEVRWQCDLFVLNPPWDLHWYRDRLRDLEQSELLTVRDAFSKMDTRLGKETIDSTMATMMIALDRMTARGEGVLIANNATMRRLFEVYSALKTHVWAWYTVKGNPMTKIDGHQFGDDFQTAIIYFAKGHVGGQRVGGECNTVGDLYADLNKVVRWRERHGAHLEYENQANGETASIWSAVRQEWHVREGEIKDGHWNIWLNPIGEIQTNLSIFDRRSVKIDKEEAKRLFELQGQRPMQLVLQAAQRAQLRRAVEGGLWRVHPDLPRVVQDAIAEYHGVRAPLYPLSPIQRLGYLDEENSIVCDKNLFRTGSNGDRAINPKTMERILVYMRDPSRKNWHDLYSKIVHSNKTAWQLVMLMEPSFPCKMDPKDDPLYDMPEAEGVCTCHLGNPPCGYCVSNNPYKERGTIDPSDWTVVPKVETIQQMIEERPCFVAGKRYELRTKGVTVTRKTSKPSLSFGEDDYMMSGVELAIWIKDEFGYERLFMDRKHSSKGVELKDDMQDLTIDFFLEDIAENFEVPNVPDVAECQPERYAQFLGQMDVLEEMLNEVKA